ncbi:MAG: 2-C-methyl-D-erythritol 4-phosphate cytidylyltransferase [Akkermansia sp.]|nr:2-C-methyl-D-erythritol 4-phosphate cytidylyltransferase [Akkermansia sp.]
MFCAVIVAAGSSRRAGFDKLAAHLDGVPVLRRSVDAFVAAGCAAVVVVCPESRWHEVGLGAASFPIPVLRVDGGAERQNSVEAGLNALPAGTTYVAVHDGARPLITPQGIRDCLAAAQQTGAAACAHPIVDTLKRADAHACSLPEKVSRDNLWGMETPQIFDLAMLRRAYACVAEQQLVVTDEVSAVEALGVPTRLVQVGPNLKITLPGDLELAELIWQHRL